MYSVVRCISHIIMLTVILPVHYIHDACWGPIMIYCHHVVICSIAFVIFTSFITYHLHLLVARHGYPELVIVSLHAHRIYPPRTKDASIVHVSPRLAHTGYSWGR